MKTSICKLALFCIALIFCLTANANLITIDGVTYDVRLGSFEDAMTSSPWLGSPPEGDPWPPAESAATTIGGAFGFMNQIFAFGGSHDTLTYRTNDVPLGPVFAYSVYADGDIIAGYACYEDATGIHTRYISSSMWGPDPPVIYAYAVRVPDEGKTWLLLTAALACLVIIRRGATLIWTARMMTPFLRPTVRNPV